MATSNGSNGHVGTSEAQSSSIRFTGVPSTIEVAISGGGDAQVVDIDLEELVDDPTELCDLLENENATKNIWTTIAIAYAKQNNIETAIEIINNGLNALTKRKNTKDKVYLYNCLCWLYLLQSRNAPRRSDVDPNAKTKDHYFRAATSTLNDASRISPSFPPLFLARGVLCLLRASLIQELAEKNETLNQASKAFDDASRFSGGNNMMALLGKARVQYAKRDYRGALESYQTILQRAPDLSDPDPRIGIGCCLWMLNFKDNAKHAWERALEIDSESKVANLLMGLYHLQSSHKIAPNDPSFASTYKKAMVEYAQKAFKKDKELPLACATFAGYFIARKAWSTVETLARKAIDKTDVNAVASDGWYLLARKEHYGDDPLRAAEYYNLADQARGGDQAGYLPAKFGTVQLKILQKDLDGAKYRLEKIIQQTKNVEAMSLLGALLVEDILNATSETTKEELANTTRKAIALLEGVRNTWKDPSKKISPDSSVLLNLARLYETENPDKSLQCLQHVEQIELEEVPEDVRPDDVKDESAWLGIMREFLPPQLLNNMACFHYQTEKYTQAHELFQTALTSCVKLDDADHNVDVDALVTTISYNLARTYEAENMLDEAKKVYEGLLNRHSNYIDANIRLTFIDLLQNPTAEGPKAMSKLYESESTDMEVRSLYAWFLRKSKKQTMNIAEDQEQRHFKHTLQSHDKHDRYALTGMGNLYLATAREMRRNTDQDKDKRSKMYARGVEIFDKALQLDPKNAFAAQGIAIALIEDKRDFATGLQVLLKVKETLRDASVHINLGHVYCELKQYARAIESYEAALAKDRANDAQILACLGRTWLLRGKQDKNISSMKSSLEYSQRAYKVSPEQVHFRFNIAFTQLQISQLLISLPVSSRSLEEIQTSATDLDTAIDSFVSIARSPHPPFPRQDIEQRASMARNTIRKQLDRAIAQQREYEEQNEERMRKARAARDAEMQRREEERRKMEEELAAEKARLAAEREKMREHDRVLMERRLEAERAKEAEMSLDEDGKEKKKRGGRKSTAGGKRKKKSEDFVNDDSDLGGAGDESGAAGGNRSTSATPDAFGSDAPAGPARPKKKRRRLERKSKVRDSAAAKKKAFKSAERIVDSDEDDEEGLEPPTREDDDENEMSGGVGGGGGVADGDEGAEGADGGTDAESDEDAAQPKKGKRRRAVLDDDDDENEGEDLDVGGEAAADEGAPDTPAAGAGDEGSEGGEGEDENVDEAAPDPMDESE